ncbi:MAG: hypothetical protein LBL62_06270 [Planctomycetaceae bacterium]|nr:hypothetical protein [Planctomycetaceae bacterium]
MFQFSIKENGNSEYCRHGITNHTQLLATGLISILAQCCVLPWVVVILSGQSGIVGGFGGKVKSYSFEWWILAVIILSAYLISLYMLKRFIDLCFSPFYIEKIIVSDDFLILQKKQIPLYTKSKSFNYDLLVKIIVQNDEVFSQKYFCLYPPPDKDFIKSYENEYRLCFIVHKSPPIIIDTLFNQEVQIILYDIQKRRNIVIVHEESK